MTDSSVRSAREAVDIDEFVARRTRPGRPQSSHMSARGTKAMVSTSHPVATEAALDALRAGGSAVDAYLAAAAVQTVVEPVMTSLAGGLGVTVWDPSAGESHLSGGSFGRPAAEDGKFDEEARESGRTVTCPGWVAGAHTAWQRWGKLGWPDVFTRALECAREGFEVDPLLWGWMYEYRIYAGRYEPGREVWFPDGRLVQVGDVVRQPKLAATIERIMSDGPGYVYTGEFARRYVDVARSAGGRITLDDMAAHPQTAMVVPLPTLKLADGRTMQTTGPLFALALNLAIVGGLKEPAAHSAATLYALMRIVEECWHAGLDLGAGEIVPPAEQMERLAELATPEHAEKLWPRILSDPARPYDPITPGTNAIVVADESGMIAHGTHSSTSRPFGTGLMVDGVIVTRPLLIYADPVPMPAGLSTSLLVSGETTFAAGSPSISCFTNVFQNAFNVLVLGMDPSESVQQPMFGAPHYPSRRPMVESTFSGDIIEDVESRGIGVTRVSPWEPEIGSCQAVLVDQDSVTGVADPRRFGRAAGS